MISSRRADCSEAKISLGREEVTRALLVPYLSSVPVLSLPYR